MAWFPTQKFMMTRLCLLIYLKNNSTPISIVGDDQNHPVIQIWDAWKSFLSRRSTYVNDNVVPQNNIVILYNDVKSGVAIDFTTVAVMMWDNV